MVPDLEYIMGRGILELVVFDGGVHVLLLDEDYLADGYLRIFLVSGGDFDQFQVPGSLQGQVLRAPGECGAMLIPYR
jgi:hypothetical protein